MRDHAESKVKEVMSNRDITLDALEAIVKAVVASDTAGDTAEPIKGFCFSKAVLNLFTMIQAKAYPNLKVTCMSPGFIDTPMTAGWNARLSPEQGCVTAFLCLFSPVTSGRYYGSDGPRSPVTSTRDPGMPEYQGEADPDEKIYNK